MLGWQLNATPKARSHEKTLKCLLRVFVFSCLRGQVVWPAVTNRWRLSDLNVDRPDLAHSLAHPGRHRVRPVQVRQKAGPLAAYRRRGGDDALSLFRHDGRVARR